MNLSLKWLASCCLPAAVSLVILHEYTALISRIILVEKALLYFLPGASFLHWVNNLSQTNPKKSYFRSFENASNSLELGGKGMIKVNTCWEISMKLYTRYNREDRTKGLNCFNHHVKLFFFFLPSKFKICWVQNRGTANCLTH